MASGNTHDWVGLMGSVALGINLSDSPVYPLYVDAWVLAGYGLGIIWLSPDIDLLQSHPSQRWGIFRFLVVPYAKLFSHRGLSHVPVLGTLTRVIYILPLILAYPDPTFAAALIGGLEISTWVHLFCDYTPIVRKF